MSHDAAPPESPAPPADQAKDSLVAALTAQLADLDMRLGLSEEDLDALVLREDGEGWGSPVLAAEAVRASREILPRDEDAERTLHFVAMVRQRRRILREAKESLTQTLALREEHLGRIARGEEPPADPCPIPCSCPIDLPVLQEGFWRTAGPEQGGFSRLAKAALAGIPHHKAILWPDGLFWMVTPEGDEQFLSANMTSLGERMVVDALGRRLTVSTARRSLRYWAKSALLLVAANMVLLILISFFSAVARRDAIGAAVAVDVARLSFGMSLFSLLFFPVPHFIERSNAVVTDGMRQLREEMEAQEKAKKDKGAAPGEAKRG